MLKNAVVVILIGLMSCGIATFQTPRAQEPGRFTWGLGISGGGIAAGDEEGAGLFDFGPYMRIGVFKNCEFGVMVSPLTLLGITAGSVQVKYQFMSNPCGSFILGGGYVRPWSIDMTSYSESGSQVLSGTVLFGNQTFVGPKIVYLNKISDDRSEGYVLVGFMFGGATLGNLKILMEMNTFISFNIDESWSYHGFGGVIGFGFQYGL
jgi:hypothetical protein